MVLTRINKARPWTRPTNLNASWRPTSFYSKSATMTKEDAAYLEDVQPKRATEADEEPSSSRKKNAASDTVSVSAGAKRQLTLADMFGSRGGPSSSAGEPSSKRAKLSTPSGPGFYSKTSNSLKASGVQPKLNAIPFSVSAFQDSLTQEQKDLLKLECETMGKSWWV
jgi:uracil-DNA glycosylase